MSIGAKVVEEIKSLVVTMLYFMTWIGGLMLLKTLILAEYHIEATQWSLVVIGALVLAKVVLVLEHVSLGAWVQKRPALFDVVLRTVLYSFGVFVVLVLEKGFEGRHEYGGFGPAVAGLLKQADAPHIWANTICLSGALLGYNVLSVVRRQLGEAGLRRLFLSPLPEE